MSNAEPQSESCEQSTTHERGGRPSVLDVLTLNSPASVTFRLRFGFDSSLVIVVDYCSDSKWDFLEVSFKIRKSRYNNANITFSDTNILCPSKNRNSPTKLPTSVSLAGDEKKSRAHKKCPGYDKGIFVFFVLPALLISIQSLFSGSVNSTRPIL